MDRIEDHDLGMDAERLGADRPVTAQEGFVTDVYRRVDAAAACGLDRLRAEEGIVPTCRLGCCCCCRYHIPVNIAEAHTLAQYVKRELSADQINDLRIRTQRWHQWDDSRPGRYASGDVEMAEGLSDYEPCCPLLVDGACIAYPVRPVICRTHFVSSPPRCCCAANDPKSGQDAPVALTSVVKDARPFSAAIKDHVEEAGLDFSRSIMLLPHWLAIKMDWDFALQP